MTLPLIILGASSLALIAMLFYRVWEIRAGRIYVRDGDIPEKFFDIDNIEKNAEVFYGKARVFGMHAFALTLSHLGSFGKEVFLTAKKEWQLFMSKLPKHSQLPERNGGSSVYLKDISAHKEEVRKENGYHAE